MNRAPAPPRPVAPRICGCDTSRTYLEDKGLATCPDCGHSPLAIVSAAGPLPPFICIVLAPHSPPMLARGTPEQPPAPRVSVSADPADAPLTLEADAR